MNHFDDYIDALLAKEVSVSDIEKAYAVINSTEDVVKILDSPSVSKDEKSAVIAEIFPASVQQIMCDVADNCQAYQFEDIYKQYKEQLDKKNKIANATVFCVTEPNEQQLQGIKDFVCKETGSSTANVEIVKDDSLIGGFIIQIGNKQYDRSIKSKISKIK